MKQVEVNLATHDLNIETMEKHIQRVREVLETTDAEVIVVLEDSKSTLYDAEQMYQLTSAGVPPTLAFLSLAKDLSEHLAALDLYSYVQDPLYQDLFTYLSGESDYTMELLALDALYVSSIRTDGSPRLKVMLEGSLDSKETDYDWGVDLDRVISLYVQNNFDEALAVYKGMCNNLAGDTVRRESAMATTIAMQIDQNPNTVVISKLGTMHSGLSLELRKLGISAGIHHLDTSSEKPKLSFIPLHSTTHKIRYKGFESVTEYEWHLSIICELAFTALYEASERSGNALSYGDIIDAAVGFAENFSSMDDIRNFEKLVRKQGLVGALETFDNIGVE